VEESRSQARSEVHAGLAARTQARASPPAGSRSLEPLVKQAHALVADLSRPRPSVYYADLALSATVAWGALLASAAVRGPGAALPFALAVLALYRAASFIHELSHLRPGAVPGFSFAWNTVIGVPLLLPSMLYIGVHAVHHARAHYGTRRDPEYLPIGRWPPWKIAVWVLHAALLPAGLVLRFLVLAPLSLLHPGLRSWVWRKASGLTINPAFERGPPPAALRTGFLLQEAACCAWALALALLTAAGAVPLRPVLLGLGAASAVGLLNQLRTAVAHRFRSEGEELTFEEQFLDSVNVPGRSLLTGLWAPVGLRFHALHHLLPGLPYHALGAAHRRLVAALPSGASYHRANEASLRSALFRLMRGSRAPAINRRAPSRGPSAPWSGS